MTEPIRVVVVDDHSAIRDGLRPWFEKAEGMAICGEAGSAAEAVQMVESLRPDVAVIDYSLLDGTVIDVMKQIRSRGLQTPVIVYTGLYGYRIRPNSIAAGAAGYVTKDQPTEDLIWAVREVAEGRNYFGPPAASPTWIDTRKNPNPNGTHPSKLLAQLTKREWSILELLAEGWGNEEIGAGLSISPITARNRVSDVLRKLGLTNRTQAAAFLTRWG